MFLYFAVYIVLYAVVYGLFYLGGGKESATGKAANRTYWVLFWIATLAINAINHLPHKTTTPPSAVAVAEPSPVNAKSTSAASVNAEPVIPPVNTITNNLSEGKNLYNQERYAEALPLLQETAEQGNAEAQGLLGLMYYEGKGVTQDYSQAVTWLFKSAEQGNTTAQNNLGALYAVVKDDAQSIYWYRKAAEQGDDAAQDNLGNRYYFGRGIEQDKTQAVYWWRKAAEQGNVLAQYNLGIVYGKSENTDQDKEQALYWLHKAAEQGHRKAQEILSQIGQ